MLFQKKKIKYEFLLNQLNWIKENDKNVSDDNIRKWL